MKKTILVLNGFIIILLFSGCLKTRSQMREDKPPGVVENGPVEPKEIQPHGRYVIDELKSEMMQMNGRIDELERAKRMNDLANKDDARQKEDLKKIEVRIAELERAQITVLEAIKKVQEGPPPADPAALFAEGKTAFEESDYATAIEKFNELLKTPKSKYTEDGTFMRAESFYAQKQYKKAIVDYSKFEETFKKSKHSPKALFKIGLSFEAMGSPEDAKAFYELLVRNHPKSPEAQKVKKKLKK